MKGIAMRHEVEKQIEDLIDTYSIVDIVQVARKIMMERNKLGKLSSVEHKYLQCVNKTLVELSKIRYDNLTEIMKEESV
jgi:acetolactate synthase small subunit